MGYENGKIYTIRSHQTDDIYIGSTTQPLYKRIHQHKINFKRWENKKYNYVTSYELIKYDDAYIELLELCPCDSKMELHKREGELQREMDCVNKFVAGRIHKESQKVYRENNKDKIKESRKVYRENNKDKIKEYRENNKDKKKEYNKEYRKENKDKIKEKTNKKYNCECGGRYTLNQKLRHSKTKKHTNYIISTNNTND